MRNNWHNSLLIQVLFTIVLGLPLCLSVSPSTLKGIKIKDADKRVAVELFHPSSWEKKEPNIMGTWSTNNFSYKPDYGESGADKKAIFDTSLDRIDARLGQEIWVGDPNYPTFAEAIANIGSNKTLLRIPSNSIAVTSNITIPANVTMMLCPGAMFNIASGDNLTINGPIYCLSSGPYFEVNTGASLNINGPLFSVGDQLFSGPGTINVNSEPVILSYIKPPQDSNEAFQFRKSDGTCLFNIDSINNEITHSGDLIVNGNIQVTGQVDGLDISTLNQSLGTTSSPSFAGLTVNGDIAVGGTVDGVDVSAHVSRHEAGGTDVLPHQTLSGAGTNSHSQIDTHMASNANPHQVTAAQIGLGNVSNDAQVPLATVTSKGDLVAATGNTAVARLGVGSDGQVLTADSGQTTGIKWTNPGVTWGNIAGSLSSQTDLENALKGKVSTTTNINGHALSSDITVTASDVGLGNVSNDKQVKAGASSVNGNFVAFSGTTGDQAADSGYNPSSFVAAQPAITPGTYTKLTYNAAGLVTVGTAASPADIGLGNLTNDAQLKRSANDFSTFQLKTTPASNDVLLIEDSAASGAKKYITVSSLPTGLGSSGNYPAPILGTTTGYSSLSTALATIGSTNTTLTIPATLGAINIANNTTIPANVSLDIQNGAYFNVSAGVTLTINGPLMAGNYKIFSLNGTGKATLGQNRKLNVCWWGADLSGTKDSSAAFNSMIDSTRTGAVLDFVNVAFYAPAGIYQINNPVNFTNIGNFTFYGDPFRATRINLATNGQIGFDFTGAFGWMVRDFYIFGQQVNAPSCSMFFARSNHSSAGNGSLHRVNIEGNFTAHALIMMGQDVTSVRDFYIWLAGTAPMPISAFCAGGTNHSGVSSYFATDVSTGNNPFFMSDGDITMDTNNTTSMAMLLIDGPGGATFENMYIHCNAEYPIKILNTETNGGNNQAFRNINMESAASTAKFLITSEVANTKHSGLRIYGGTGGSGGSGVLFDGMISSVNGCSISDMSVAGTPGTYGVKILGNAYECNFGPFCTTGNLYDAIWIGGDAQDCRLFTNVSQKVSIGGRSYGTYISDYSRGYTDRREFLPNRKLNFPTVNYDRYYGLSFESAVPTSGDWCRGSVVFNNNANSGQPMGWMCTYDGTMGTLNSGNTIGNVIHGTKIMTVNDLTGLDIGNWINIAGASNNPFIVRQIDQNTKNVYLNAAVTTSGNVDLTNAAVSYRNATFAAMPNLP